MDLKNLAVGFDFCERRDLLEVIGYSLIFNKKSLLHGTI